MIRKKMYAFLVHLLTASGMAAGMGAMLAIHDHMLQMALWLLGLAVFIDSVDGTLARKFKTRELAHSIDGALLDNIIDYVTWTVLPLFWGYVALGLPPWILIVAATASALGFANRNAKTADHFFEGFPSYWNIVILYCYLLNFSVQTVTAVLLLCSILIFVPIKWVYPSRTDYLQGLTLSLGAVFIIQLVALIYFLHDSPPWLIYSSLIFPIYYFILSLYLNVTTKQMQNWY